ncbi:MAG TPA: TAT-variant-translocated molybdopterin oxidoreductase [Vicinamibacterales bacterium]|nr:TAT-variant-translocated molybdopterin oxidoreductase [Vicinamibacterales bacterium]
MNLADIRSRLAGLEGRTYWRSLEELADTPEFRDYVGREFPAQASEFTDPAGRREFLKLMGASLALAGVSACTRIPDEKIIPYVRQPEDIVPGRPLFFATAMPHGGFAMPVLAENHMGRPTKIEGNPEHPASLGATDVWGQASVLSVYDPDRSRTVMSRGEVKTWGAFLIALQAAVTSQRGLKGQGLRILSEPITSPSLIDQMQTLMAALPEAKWHQWDPVFGAVQGGAPSATPLYRFDKADVVVALDADFLGFGPGALRYTRDFASRRRIGTPQDELNRLYAIEPVPTITGAKADHRLPLKARDVRQFAVELAAALGVGRAGGVALQGDAARWIQAIADDLKAHRGRSVVVAGDRQPATVHALARMMNDTLGNSGVTVSYVAPIVATPADGAASLAELVADMNAKKVDALLILGGNPVFNAPVDLDFAKALDNVTTRFHLGLYYDETAELCHWHVPEAHYLESWGDARSFDGTVSLIQPLIAPLYDGRQAIEVLSAMNGKPADTPVDLVKDYWSRAFGGKTKTAWAMHDADGKPFESFDRFWRRALHDGFLAGTSMLATAPPAPPVPMIAETGDTVISGMEIVFSPDPTVLDGRYANNGWLQELPKPLSKVTWDNVAYISVKTAERLGITVERPGSEDNDILEISYNGRTARLPVWVMPGTADDVVAVHFGYGRRKAGRIGTGLGHDVFGLRTSDAPWFGAGAQVTRTNERYLITSTQNHFAMEGRNLVRVVEAEEYRTNPRSVAELGPEKPAKTLSLFPPREYTGNKWGMSIDLNACTGCGVCVAACVSENNIPVVGKAQIYRQREMHWIRVDTYYEGSLDAPRTYNQPVPCQQCEDAPCELVCPVAATSHSDEGLNDMVYNRCVGTRYCSNNCPYKVRRFNFLLYSDFTTPELFAQRNPDVTIRSRGVMEKCTYCVQRIDHARIDAKTEGRPIRDGEVQTACQQACPAEAITFGNLNDPDSEIVKRVKQDRNYGLLEDLGTRPRTTYLAVVRNPNPALEPKTPARAKGE